MYLEDKLIREYNIAMQPFIDNVDEYCETHTKTECNDRTKLIN